MLRRLLFLICFLAALVIPANNSVHATEGGTVPPYNYNTIAAGLDQTCMISDLYIKGGVLCWGKNSVGQLGNNSTTDSSTPQKVYNQSLNLLGSVVSLAAGWYHTCALLESGYIDCWGYNYDGELGDGTNNNHSVATMVTVTGSDTFQAVTAGWNYTCALDTSGAVYCWGSNKFGKLGSGWPVSLPTKAIAIVAGESHTCAVLDNNQVMCWGYNYYGQLGDPAVTATSSSGPVNVASLTDVTAIAAGFLHNCAVTGGTVDCWGWNNTGQLGNGSTTDSAAVVPTHLSNVQTVSAGFHHSCALLTSGSVDCWGWNLHGQLGTGNYLDSYVPIGPVVGLSAGTVELTVGQNHSCIKNNAGGVWCWGENYDGQLGDGGPEPYSNVPVCVMGFCKIPLTQPVITLNTDYYVNEGSTITISATGADPLGGSLTFSWDLDGDNIFEIPGSSAVFSAANLDGSSNHTIQVRATSSEGYSNTASTAVHVIDPPPAVVMGPNVTLVAGDRYTSSGSVSDVIADSLTGTVDYGDGTGVQVLTINPNDTFVLDHVYSTASTYILTVTVTDDPLATVSGSLVVTVITPEQAINDLIAQVQALVSSGKLNQGQGNALIVKLDNAQKFLSQGEPKMAVNMLQAFVNQVNSLISENVLLQSDGQPLVDLANLIISAIGK